MDFDKLWDQIFHAATRETFNVSTVPQNRRTPLWFKVYTKNEYLYVDNTSDKSPSVKLSGARRITKDDFLKVVAYYERWRNGETHLRQEVREQSMNTAYIFGLISKFSNS